MADKSEIKTILSLRIVYLTLALICFAAAGVLIVQAGLPNRAEYVGIVLTPGGIPTAPEINAFAPSFDLLTLDGDTLNISNLRGSVVLVNFWATWCEPCRLEMPALQRLYSEYQAQGLRMVGVNLGESPETVQRWVEEMGLTFDVALDIDGKVAALYQLRGQPTTILIDRQGIIQQIIYGAADIDTLRQVTEALLIN